ncbi:hypothetical protein EON80_10800 [bacterium]|nr:MAG: hypothetical protein EON80_10800 [bacterium]
MNKARYLSAPASLALLLLLVAGAQTAPQRVQSSAAKVAAVFQAIRSEKLPALKTLLQSGALVNSVDSSGETPLMVAVDCCETESKNVNLPAAQLLLKHGAKPNLRDRNRRTALFYAIESESGAAVRLLVRHGAEVNIEGQYGETPLNLSIQRDQITIPQILLEAGAKARGLHNDNSPLHIAAGSGNVTVARLLVGRGASVTQVSEGATPLQAAATARKAAMVKFLLEKGARVDARGERGETALLSATTFGDYQTVAALLKAGANPNLADREGATPLLYACMGLSPDSLKIARALLEKGANPNLGPQRGSPLASAARSGAAELVQLLLQKGADPRKGGEEAPLQAVLKQGNRLRAQMALWGYGGEMTEAQRRKAQAEAEAADLSIVRALLAKGVSVSEGASRTLLIDAAKGGNVGIVQLMLQKGAPPNVSDKDIPLSPEIAQMLKNDPEAAAEMVRTPETFGIPTGKTPLIAAAENGHAAVVAALLKAGAEPNLSDKNGKTPLLALAGAGRSKMARELPGMREAVLHRADEDNPKPVSREVKPAERAAMNKWADEGDTAIVRALLAKGAKVDERDRYGRTALMLAARLGRASVVRDLLEGGADINAVDVSGRSALMQTITDGRRQNAPQLFSQESQSLLRMYTHSGGKQDAATQKQVAALRTVVNKEHAAIYAQAISEDLEVLKLLKEQNADLSLKDKGGATALQLAQKWKYGAAIEFLSRG